MDLLTGETVLWKGSPSWRALLLFYISGTIGALVPVIIWLILNDLMGDPPSATWFAIRRVIVVVLPEPAPARMQTGPRTVSTARRCSGFNPSKIAAASPGPP